MPIRICYLSAEMAPFAKVGGLADVSGALVKYLYAAGHDMRLFMPFHGSIPREGFEAYPVAFLPDGPVAIGKNSYRFSVQTARLPGTDAFVYLVDCPAGLGGPSVYPGRPLRYA